MPKRWMVKKQWRNGKWHKTRVIEKKSYQCLFFVRYKYHTECPGSETGPLRWEAGDWLLQIWQGRFEMVTWGEVLWVATSVLRSPALWKDIVHTKHAMEEFWKRNQTALSRDKRQGMKIVQISNPSAQLYLPFCLHQTGPSTNESRNHQIFLTEVAASCSVAKVAGTGVNFYVVTCR